MRRSPAYHRRKLRSGSDRYRQAICELNYLRNNRDKMDYAGYHTSGLILSSGPVEGAAKILVGHRLKHRGQALDARGARRSSTYGSTFIRNDGMPFWNWYLRCLFGTGTFKEPPLNPNTDGCVNTRLHEKQKSIMSICLALFALVVGLGGCGESNDNDPPPTAPREAVVRPTGELKPWDLSPIVPVDSVRSMPTGTPVFLRTEFAHGALADLEMTFIQVVDDFLPSMPVYMLEASDPVLIQLGGIAQGMSGSPIFTEQGTWGAIAYGYAAQDSPPFYFFATPIEWVIGDRGTIPLAKPTATWEGNRIAPLDVPLLATGLGVRYQPNELRSSLLSELTSAGKTQQRQGSFEAGRPLAVALLLGEVTAAGLGTISYVDGNRIYGFGHPMFAAGPVELPIIEAQVLGEMSNLYAPFKFATLNPTVRGTLTEDRLSGVRGMLGDGPELVPIRSVYTFPSGSVLERTHRLATRGLDPFMSTDLVTTAFFSPLFNRVENEPNHSIRVETTISFVETDSILARSRLYADPEGRLASLIGSAMFDLSDVLGQLMTRTDYALQLREAEIHIELVPESRFAKVAAVAADTVVSAGSTLAITTSLRVGRRSGQEVELALSLPDTLPVGVYQLEVGSAATLGDDEFEFFGSGGMFDGLDETLEDLFARVNEPDKNVLLKARLTFVMPSEEDALKDPLPDLGEGSEVGVDELLDFAMDLFPSSDPAATISTSREVDLFLAASQTLQIQVVVGD